MSNISNLLQEIKVYTLNGTKIRIGNKTDGGYVALKELCCMPPVVYSFGVGNDVGFELDWVKRYPETQFELFDPTINDLPQEHARFTLHKYGIGAEFKPLETVAQNALLKMDVEGDEMSAILGFNPEDLQKFSQILIECHFLHVQSPSARTSYFKGLYSKIASRVNEDLFCQYYETIFRLNQYFTLFHIHANNSLPGEHKWLYLPTIIGNEFCSKGSCTKSGEILRTFSCRGSGLPKQNRSAGCY